MTYRSIWTMAGTAALGLVLVALPGASQSRQEPDDSPAATLNRSYRDLERLHAALRHSQELSARAQQLAQEPRGGVVDDQDNEVFVLNDLLADMEEGSGWLGVETRDVNAEKAKELKLPGERGVLLTGIVPDSPAAKAGLKENDVITEINGQRVEGAFQFRRMIHEIPAGRAVQLGIVRDGRPQSISVTLGKAEERGRTVLKGSPSRSFSFHMPELPKVSIEPFELYGDLHMSGNRPRLGIDGEDLGGQLGAYFGAPDGEGILVREVQSGSAAEKAGIKAGDVLVKFNGERLRTVGDLREKLGTIHEQKTVKLGVLRNRSEISLDAAIAPPERPKPRKLAHSTGI